MILKKMMGKNYNVQTILKCISNCLEDEGLGQYCIIQYLNTLKTIMLPNEYIRCHIDACNWDVMFKRIKSRFRDEIDLHRKDAKDILETIVQYLKYGPLHGFSPEILRGQFDFISKLCKEISVNFSRPIQSAVIEIAYYLCYHTAKDNRMSCCKLGEETFSFLISLYEIQNPRDDGMKIQLLKYFLMQLVMHNPRGVSEGHPGAYAYCWKTWNNCLKSIHEKCYEDISHSQKLYPHYNNEVLFLVDKGIKFLQEDFARLFAEVIKQGVNHFQFCLYTRKK
ncbi:hypothetical protein HHI36_012743 [Cryptolaemus montrouzieri]|uniref:Uncharacterized protein n=1 Tax=Cryptolaemus montrouzieri TaxID=559131 RepID=A0ABD2NFL7_9CUCU